MSELKQEDKSPPVVLLESPFSGDIQANEEYAWKALRDCYLRGEAPIATHLMWTKLSDKDEFNGKTIISDSVNMVGFPGRVFALEAGDAIRNRVDYVVFYVDRGWSNGMTRARDHCMDMCIRAEIRNIEPPKQNLTDAQSRSLHYCGWYSSLTEKEIQKQKSSDGMERYRALQGEEGLVLLKKELEGVVRKPPKNMREANEITLDALATHAFTGDKGEKLSYAEMRRRNG